MLIYSFVIFSLFGKDNLSFSNNARECKNNVVVVSGNCNSVTRPPTGGYIVDNLVPPNNAFLKRGQPARFKVPSIEDTFLASISSIASPLTPKFTALNSTLFLFSSPTLTLLSLLPLRLKEIISVPPRVVSSSCERSPKSASQSRAFTYTPVLPEAVSLTVSVSPAITRPPCTASAPPTETAGYIQIDGVTCI